MGKIENTLNTEKYIRQIILQGFGSKGQQKLHGAKVLVVGAGGLGVPVLTYLNAMGIGVLGVIDGDTVAVTNLHRQVLYTPDDIGKPKVEVAVAKLKAQNPQTNIIGYTEFLSKENALRVIAAYHLVVDASDNFSTRYLINDACVILNKPFVYGALHGFEGQVSVFNYRNGPTYRCLFPDRPQPNEVPNCNEHGVLGVIPGIVGNFQALEVVKVLAGIGEVLSGRLLLFDGLQQTYQTMRFKLIEKNLQIKQLKDSYEWDAPCQSTLFVTPKEFQKLLEERIQVIDVRTLEEYQEFHLPHTVHIPLASLEQESAEIDFSIPVYVICQSGQRSQTALKRLQEQHPERICYSVLGGLNSYLASCS